jgi:MFS family permease
MVITATLGVALSTVAVYSVGQFITPLEEMYGWSRTQIMGGVSVSSFTLFVLAGFVGRIVDKVDVRWIVIPGIVICSLSLAAFSLMHDSLAFWYMVWGGYALGAALIAPTPWLASVSAVFSKGRSVAIAVVLSGAGVASAFGPASTRYLIDGYRWQVAFPVLAALWGGSCLVMTLFFFSDRRRQAAPASSAAVPAAPRIPLRALLGKAAFLMLTVAIFAVMTVDAALMINLAPLLVDYGFTRTDAASLAGLIGAGIIIGKLFAGWLFELVPSGFVTTAAMGSLALGCIILHYTQLPVFVVGLACFALGAASGSTMTVTACLTTRLFRSQDFGTVYGTLLSVMALAGIVGPLLAGVVYDSFGSYRNLIWLGLAVAVVASVLLALAGRAGSAAEASYV